MLHVAADVVLALGCGLRQGEVLGLPPEDVDFARGVLWVRRQVQLLGGRMYFTLPKGGKARVVDMPRSVASALAEYFVEYPAVEVELPWGGPEPERENRRSRWTTMPTSCPSPEARDARPSTDGSTPPHWPWPRRTSTTS
ncbi:integrase [Streptomyces netropsis]|uniref:Integrase n=1 Tax=Streptomyces netropsis TaxID=55404 RepID=A0A7W7LI13_STRNE|nr:integrase [Streptomyces netropsis]